MEGHGKISTTRNECTYTPIFTISDSRSRYSDIHYSEIQTKKITLTKKHQKGTKTLKKVSSLEHTLDTTIDYENREFFPNLFIYI